MGASAAAQGDTVIFRDAAPSKETVAHEVAHVVQARDGGGGGAGVTSPSDAVEREARDVAPRAAAGEPVSVSQGAGGAIAREDEEAAADPVSQIRVALDDDEENEAIRLMGTLSAGQANTVLNTMQELAVDAFGNDEMGVACAWLVSRGGSLSKALAWMFDEGTDAALLTSTIQQCTDMNRRRALATDAWKERFSDELGNDEMSALVDLLGFHLADKLEWMFYEGTDWAALQGKIAACADMNQRRALATDTWKERFADELGNDEMALLVGQLGFDLVDQLDWMLFEGTSWDDALAKANACADTGQAAALDTQAWRAKLIDEFDVGRYWRLVLTVAHGGEAAIPPPGLAVLAVLNEGTSDVVRVISGMSDADWAALKALVAVRAAVYIAAGDQGLRALDEGLVSEQTGIEGSFSEDLLADPDASNPTGPFQSMNFGASTEWDCAYYRDRLEVTVKINLQAADAGATAAVSSARATCAGIIQGAWNGKFTVSNPDHTLPLQFNPVFTGGGAHQTVNLRSGTPTWPGYNMGNWYVNDPTRANSLNSCAHEFGHMLGNPDEYWRPASDYQEVVGVDPTADPNASVDTDSAGTDRFTNTASIMGSGGHNGTIDPRHVDRFLTWLNQNRRRDSDSGRFAEDPFRLV